MHLLELMQPRDHALARRTVVALLSVAVVVTIITAPFTADGKSLTPAGSVVLLAVGALLGALVSLAYYLDQVTKLVWTLVPLSCVALLTAVNLLTGDASVKAQIFFVLPAIYGAALLPRQGAIVMLVASLVGELVVVVSLSPWRVAAVEFLYVAAALSTMTVVLVRSGERQALLMAKLRSLAAIDSLTGLATRRVLDEAATAALSGAPSDEGTSLVLLDVDMFKSVNDRYGHPGGDKVLVQLAEVVLRRSRRSDVICRMGGDELALLLSGCSAEVAERRAQGILDDVRGQHFVTAAGERIPVSVSIGIAHAPTHATDLQALYAAADAALYQAKVAGRDRFMTQDPHR